MNASVVWKMSVSGNGQWMVGNTKPTSLGCLDLKMSLKRCSSDGKIDGLF